MIAWIKGTVLRKGNNFLIVQSDNLGFKVFVSPAVLLKAGLSDQITLWTHEQHREDGREFYGFTTPEELEFFWKLITVSGVGPKLAMNIISFSNVAAAKKWIDEGNVAALSDVHGVGKKTAQKIVLDLKGKLADSDLQGDEAAEALVGLGYSRDEAKRALTGITAASAEERIRSALKALGKK